MITLAVITAIMFTPKLLNNVRKNPTHFTIVVMSMLVALVGCIFLSLTAQAENRTRVAIIDTGVDFSTAGPFMCKDGHKDFTGKGLTDAEGHGTNIAGIITRNMNRNTHCIQVLKWYHNGEKDKPEVVRARVLSALKRALEYKAKYVNLSMSGTLNSVEEYTAIYDLLESGAKVFVAAGNDGQNLNMKCDIYPACYHIHNPNFYVVANYNNSSSNFANWVKWEDGNNVEGFGHVSSGTSQATAVFLSKKLKSEYR